MVQQLIRNEPGRGRKNRVGVSLETHVETSLERLAVSCGMTPTTLAYLFVKHCLEDSTIVHLYQMDYNINPAYWVMPVRHPNGKTILEIKTS